MTTILHRDASSMVHVDALSRCHGFTTELEATEVNAQLEDVKMTPDKKKLSNISKILIGWRRGSISVSRPKNLNVERST